MKEFGLEQYAEAFAANDVDAETLAKLTAEDEDATRRRLSEYHDLIAAIVERYTTRIMHHAGDPVLAMFDSVVDALSSAVAIQSSHGT